MLSENAQRATLTTIASFPRQYFLENMAIRDDNSILVTVANHKELWYIPPSSANVPVSPLLLCTFPQSAMQLLGPTSGAWGRGPGEYGRVAYFLTDGGTKSPPPDGIARPATVVRVEFKASP